MCGILGWVGEESVSAEALARCQQGLLALANRGPDGSRQAQSYEHANTVRLNFEAWADALERRAPYRFTNDQLLANIRILDAVTRSAAADGKPVAL